jgi:PhnB protein
MKNTHVRIPPRYSRVDPWVIRPDTDAEIGFLTRVFAATETAGSRMLDGEGRIGHVEVEIGGSVIMMFDAHPEWPPLPAHLRVYVDDVRRVFAEAVRAGARAVTEPTELVFAQLAERTIKHSGERVARIRDPQGHLWWIHEHVEDIDPAELAEGFAAPGALEAMAYVQRSLSAELSRGIG